jgi:hypothetical protein
LAALVSGSAGNGGSFVTVNAEPLLPSSRRLTAGANITLTDGGAGSTITIASTGGSVSPLTTKGDLYGFDVANQRIPVGTDGQILAAASSQPLGVQWVTPPGTKSQEFNASGTFNVPTFVSFVWVSMVGAGGGGSTTIAAATGGGGGGTGEYCFGLPVVVTPGGTVTVTIGTGGTGGAAAQVAAQAGANGGDTSFGIWTVKGGGGALNTGASGVGGGPLGAASKPIGNPGTAGGFGSPESPLHFGGSSGGGGGNAITASGGAGAPGAGQSAGAAGGVAAGSQAGGGGGGGSPWGNGAVGANGGVAGANATNAGTGGSGSGGHATTTLGGGNGANGYCLVTWIT